MGPRLKSVAEFLLFPPQRINLEKLLKAVSGKTILVTGASFGIGEALVRRLAPCGVHLILVARTTEKLEHLKTEIEQLGSTADIFTADLYQEADTDKVVEFLKGLLDRSIDIFVNNAGKSIRRSLFDSLDRYHDFTRTMAINYFAPVKIILALVPALQKNKGQIINISAANVLLVPAPLWAAYQASKAAFDNWLRAALPELRAKGISVSTLYLPLVKTRMIEPTESYRNLPAMTPDAVAVIICRLMISGRNKYRPWWLIFPQVLSVLLRGFWERISTNALKKSGHAADN
jgi:short-subunit dehydrogenase